MSELYLIYIIHSYLIDKQLSYYINRPQKFWKLVLICGMKSISLLMNFCDYVLVNWVQACIMSSFRWVFVYTVYSSKVKEFALTVSKIRLSPHDLGHMHLKTNTSYISYFWFKIITREWTCKGPSICLCI